MNEFNRRPSQTHHPDGFYGTKGREIGGYIDVPMHFETLRPGQDYTVVLDNPYVETTVSPENFFVFANPVIGERSLDTEAPHWRSVTFSDIQTAVLDPETEQPIATCYDINVKGIGFLKRTDGGIRDGIESFDTWTPTLSDTMDPEEVGPKVLGLTDRSEYYGDFPGGIDNVVDMTAMLAASGLRTEVYWKVARLDQIYYQGEPRKIEDLIHEGVLPDNIDYQPYMGIRLLRTNTRIAEFCNNPIKKDAIWEKSWEIFEREQRESDPTWQAPQDSSAKQRMFMHSFAKKMGQNLAVMHNLGLADSYMHSANVTMAAEVADIASITNVQYESQFIDGAYVLEDGMYVHQLKDVRDVFYSLKMLSRAFNFNREDFRSLGEIIFDTYKEKLDEDKVSLNTDCDPQRYLAYFEAMSTRFFQNGRNLKKMNLSDPHETLARWNLAL